MDARNEETGTDAFAARPAFSPPPEMRQRYLDRRRAELGALVTSARGNEWKFVVGCAHHVRGSGAMYGFVNIGATADSLCRAIQGADPDCLERLDAYVKAVSEAYV